MNKKPTYEELEQRVRELEKADFERKQVEMQLRRNERLFNDTQQLAKIGGWEVDLVKQTTFWTNEVFRIHDLNPDRFRSLESNQGDGTRGNPSNGLATIGEAVKLSIACYDPEDRPVVVDAFKKCAEKGQPYDLEFPFTTIKGRRIWIRTIANPMVKDGQVAKVVGYFMDITERKRSEAEREKIQIRLNQAQKMESIGTLAGGIAHDFNNILAALIGYTELLKLSLPSDSREMDNANQILKAGNRAKDLVKQILTFSRQTEKEFVPVSVSIIVKEVAKLLRSSLPATIEIKQNIQSDLLVMGDPTQFHQILMNLCTNAGHAMQEKGGLLSIELEKLELKEDLVSDQITLKPGTYVQLSVTDTGHGIPAEQQDRIFDPFFTTKERGEGTGMGLSVVHGIVKSYQGAIYAYSDEGEGTTFKVFLPAIEQRTEPEKRVIDDIPRGSEHILLVDDESVLLEMGTSQLETLGYKVTARSNGREALKLFEIKPDRFDLVITDMTMPKMTGDEFASAIKRIRPDIPVILCTGFSSKLTSENVHQFDIEALLMKPVIIGEMARIIRKVLDEPRSPRTTELQNNRSPEPQSPGTSERQRPELTISQ